MEKSVSYLPVRGFRVIRITCNHPGCEAVVELPPSRVEEVMKKTKGCCPVCNKPFTIPEVEGGADVLTMLAKAVLAMNELASNVGVELPVNLP
jgi:hypothetical protein